MTAPAARDPAADAPPAFGYAGARSAAVSGGLALAVCVEAVVVHLWLRERHPALAWALAAASALTLAWLLVEYRAWGAGRIRVAPTHVVVRIAGRGRVDVPRAALAVVPAPGWRERPAAGTPGYLNLTGPAEPNVLLVPAAPVFVRLLGGLVRRRATTIGLHLDDPAAFAARLAAPTDDFGAPGASHGKVSTPSPIHAPA